jgi:hypothetical protein
MAVRNSDIVSASIMLFSSSDFVCTSIKEPRIILARGDLWPSANQSWKRPLIILSIIVGIAQKSKKKK